MHKKDGYYYDLPLELIYPIGYNPFIEELVRIYRHVNMIFIFGALREELDKHEHGFIEADYTLQMCDFVREHFEDVEHLESYTIVDLDNIDGNFYLYFDPYEVAIYYADDIGYNREVVSDA